MYHSRLSHKKAPAAFSVILLFLNPEHPQALSVGGLERVLKDFSSMLDNELLSTIYKRLSAAIIGQNPPSSEIRGKVAKNRGKQSGATPWGVAMVIM
ncbi:hypothetical protein Tco_1557144, partial [Tanacetum coccineum]